MLVQDGLAAEAEACDGGGPGDAEGVYAWVAVLEPKVNKLMNRTAVLRRLGHVTDAGLVTLKGRAACEMGNPKASRAGAGRPCCGG